MSGRTGDRRIPWAWHLPVLALLPLAMALSWLAGRRPDLLERIYCARVYPAIVAALSALFGWLPLVAAEWLVLALVAFAILRAASAIRSWRRGFRSFRNLAARALVQLLSVASLAGFLLVLLWGLNYRRLPLDQRLGLDLRPPVKEELESMAWTFRAELEAASRDVPRSPDGTALPPKDLDAVRAGFAQLPPAVFANRIVPAPPKRPVFSFLLSATLTSGIYVPFTGEALVARGLPSARTRFVAAHEAAHRAGLAREEEASYAAILACRRHADPAWRYAGLLEAFTESWDALRSLDPEAAGRLARGLPSGIRADLRASADWHQRHTTPVSRASKRVYGQFLKSQGQPAGIASYRLVLRYLAGQWRAEQARHG